MIDFGGTAMIKPDFSCNNKVKLIGHTPPIRNNIDDILNSLHYNLNNALTPENKNKLF